MARQSFGLWLRAQGILSFSFSLRLRLWHRNSKKASAPGRGGRGDLLSGKALEARTHFALAAELM